MTGKILMLRGLPASGKSTYARNLVSRNPQYKRVNKDDLRAMLDENHYTKNNEKFILTVRDNIISEALSKNLTIIVDDTNFAISHENRLKELAKICKADFEIKDFDVDIDVCIERNSQRSNGVPNKVIWQMYTQHVLPNKIKQNKVDYNNNLEDCIIVDLDGTLALHTSGRSPYHWDRVDEDTVNQPITDIVHSMVNVFQLNVVYLSGRDECSREKTFNWLCENNMFSNSGIYRLYMRPEGDTRKDSIIKQELYENHIKNKYNVKFILDDRDSVVQMWREQGLTTLQVNYGNF